MDTARRKAIQRYDKDNAPIPGQELLEQGIEVLSYQIKGEASKLLFQCIHYPAPSISESSNSSRNR